MPRQVRVRQMTLRPKTLPSRGRPQSGFACLQPPLMSNVKRRERESGHRTNISSGWVTERPRVAWRQVAAARGRPSCCKGPSGLCGMAVSGTRCKPRPSAPNCAVLECRLRANPHGCSLRAQSCHAGGRGFEPRPLRQQYQRVSFERANPFFLLKALRGKPRGKPGSARRRLLQLRSRA
jgi:hypothetical protein